jgi:hypothetical protein
MSKSMYTRTVLTAGLIVAFAGSAALAQNNNGNSGGNTPQEPKPAMQQAQEGMPTFDEIAEMAGKAIGGREALSKVKGLHTVMSMNVMGSAIVMDSKWGREGGRLSKTESPFGNTEMGTNGTTAWMKMPTADGSGRFVLIDGMQVEQLNSQASMHMNILDPKLVAENMSSLEVVGQEEFDGRMAYKVRFEPKEEGGYGFMYFDAGSGEPLGLQQIQEGPMGEETSTITLGEWKTVEGVKFFHKMTISAPSMPGGEVVMTVSKLEVNKLADDAFELPEKVKEMAAEAEQDAEESDNPGGDENAGASDIKLEDLPESYRERAGAMIQQIKAGGAESIKRSLEQFQQVLDALPEGDDKLTLQYVMQELKKGN